MWRLLCYVVRSMRFIFTLVVRPPRRPARRQSSPSLTASTRCARRVEAVRAVPASTSSSARTSGREIRRANGNRRSGRRQHPGLHDRHQREPGGVVQFKVKTDASNYRLDIYRMGYYGGMGARKVATVNPSASLPQTQPACLTPGGDRPDRLRQLGASRHRGRCRRRASRASTSPGPCAPTPAAPATSSSSCATTAGNQTCCSRPRTPRGRPTTPTAATASTPARRSAAPTR